MIFVFVLKLHQHLFDVFRRELTSFVSIVGFENCAEELNYFLVSLLLSHLLTVAHLEIKNICGFPLLLCQVFF